MKIPHAITDIGQHTEIGVEGHLGGSVKGLTLDGCSGHDFKVQEIELQVRIELAWDSLCAFPTCMHALKIKNLK